ncbi:hypothetical protein LMG27952_06884 [Paraburkholderia hiiakae]|uniref:Uncharacterized protein n=1 Tax=Paraburkholderia hiiakae TaxID=1081782 RepID=A0ABM8P916_9BURK|nr:hypothetical protein LMG27952_06884 [Paraburkholderia hiiakae]
MDDKSKVVRELKDVLKTIESAQSVVANELSKGGNLPYAYSELRDAHDKLKRVLRNLA